MIHRICLFPGQGSQHAGIGAGLFPLFPEYMEIARSVLGYDLEALCRDNPDNMLQQTNYTQPALYVVNAMHYQKYLQDNGLPDIVLGHSLGEFNALQAAGVYDFETGLRIVQQRGALMAAMTEGGMAAVIGLELEEVRDILEARFPALDIANINTRQQVVVSGPLDALGAAASEFEEAFATYVPLKVGGAFHSRYMIPAQRAFEAVLAPLPFQAPQLTVIANVTARPYEPGQLPGLLVAQLSSPVRWHGSIRYLLACGECSFVETGPGEVLGNLVKRIERGG